jgi:UDP-2-acetamido-2,6-beta-L-arabino-hexul-4-ose reductase
MRVLITGSNGFIGKNLCAHLLAEGFGDLLPYDRQTDPKLLDQYAAACDFVFHLAGVNRPSGDSGYEENHRFTRDLTESLKKGKRNPPVVMSSSVQARLGNPYGLSKRKAENLLLEYGRETGAAIHIFRLPGVFGKWCAPNYNSVVATFCHNVSRGLPVRVDDPGALIPLVHIDDVLRAFTSVLRGEPGAPSGFCEAGPIHRITVGELKDTIQSFRDGRENLLLADMGDPLTRKLYSTYLSHLPEDAFGCALKEHRDQRGGFAECLKSAAGGQVSVNITKPGMTKGGHWHHTKAEKIVVISGSALLRFQKLGDERVLLYPVSSEKLEIVDVPPGYVHDITNTGSSDMVMLIWASEIYDPEAPDTYPGAIGTPPRGEGKP